MKWFKKKKREYQDKRRQKSLTKARRKVEIAKEKMLADHQMTLDDFYGMQTDLIIETHEKEMELAREEFLSNQLYHDNMESAMDIYEMEKMQAATTAAEAGKNEDLLAKALERTTGMDRDEAARIVKNIMS